MYSELAFLTFLAAAFTVTSASPIQAYGNSTSPSSCGDLSSVLPTSVNQTSFCSSYLSLEPYTSYIYTTVDSTVTFVPSFIPTVVATHTLTFCDGRANNVKRTADSPAYTEPPHNVPSYDPPRNASKALTSSACSCLSLPQATVTQSATEYGGFVEYTPTFTSQLTVYETYVGPSKVSLAPTYLASPTPLIVDSQFSPDSYAQLENVPFPIRFRNVSSQDRVYASINGVISIVADGGFAGTENAAIPAYNLPFDNYLIQDAFAVLWDGHTINPQITNPQSNTTQTMQYAVEGDAPCRTLTVEWVVGGLDDSTEHYRFWATFYEDKPETFRYTYWDVSDSGRSATVGAQAVRYDFEDQEGPGEFATYAYDGMFGVDIPSGLVLDYDIESNSFIASTIYDGMC